MTYQEARAALQAEHEAAQQAEGAYQQVLKQIKEQYGCGTLEEARALLVKMDKKSEEAERIYNEELNKFRGKWSHHLASAAE